MLDGSDVDLEEFKQLRAEIISRTALGNQIFSYTVVALGTGLTIFEKVHDILLILPFVSIWFWLLWLDHLAQVFKISFYISTVLGPRLRDGDGHFVLGWESFYRILDEKGLVGFGDARNIKFPNTRALFPFAAILFFGGPPILLAAYGYLEIRGALHDFT